MVKRKGKEKKQKTTTIVPDAAKQGESRDWASLTEPLLVCILSFFKTLNDFFAFRAVCPSWRLAAVPTAHTMSSQSPLVIYHRQFGFYNDLTKTYYDATQGRNYKIGLPNGVIFGYSRGHLIVRRPGYKYEGISLINIFTGAATKLGWRFCNTSKPHRFQISSSLSSADFVAVLQITKYGSLHCSTKFSNWKLMCKKDIIEDFLFFEKKLYVLTKSLQLGVLSHLSRPHDLVILDSVVALEPPDRKAAYLADSDGQLLLVCEEYDYHFKFTFSIWRWNFECGGGWVSVYDLGERSLFISEIGFIGSVSIDDNSRFRQNCIYFSDEDGVHMYSLREESYTHIPNLWPSERISKPNFSMLVLPNML